MSEFNFLPEPLTQNFIHRRLEVAEAVAKLELVHHVIDEEFAVQHMERTVTDRLEDIYCADIDTFPYGQLVLTLSGSEQSFIAAAVNRPGSIPARAHEVSITRGMPQLATHSTLLKKGLLNHWNADRITQAGQSGVLQRLPYDVSGFTRAADLAYNFVYFKVNGS